MKNKIFIIYRLCKIIKNQLVYKQIKFNKSNIKLIKIGIYNINNKNLKQILYI